MQLVRALRIQNKEVVAFVGGGGKSAAMFRLAAELAAQGKRVVTTTTTRIFAAQIGLAPYHLRAENEAYALHDLRAALRDHAHVLVIGTTNEAGKAFGISPALVDEIIALDEVDVVINEADGSRMRPFKAPGEHEPVLSASTTLLVPVVGIDALGQGLDDEHVHRAERVAQLAGVPLGATINPETIARVITHPQGGLKNKPPRARVVPLINKLDDVASLIPAREVADQMLQSEAIDAVAIGAVKNVDNPILELRPRVAAVILAAGESKRFGEPKQLLRWGETTMLGHIVEVACASGANEVWVVLGARAEEIRAEVKNPRARVVAAEAWAEGRAASIRAAVGALGKKISAAIFINADQPFLTPEVIDTLLQRYRQTLARIVEPRCEDKGGSPVLFDRALFGELTGLRGESGGRQILNAHPDWAERVNISDTRAAIDIDTREDYERARAM